VKEIRFRSICRGQHYLETLKSRPVVDIKEHVLFHFASMSYPSCDCDIFRYFAILQQALDISGLSPYSPQLDAQALSTSREHRKGAFWKVLRICRQAISAAATKSRNLKADGPLPCVSSPSPFSVTMFNQRCNSLLRKMFLPLDSSSEDLSENS
jgi:hypothetical protein